METSRTDGAKKRFGGRKESNGSATQVAKTANLKVMKSIPDDILDDSQLAEAIKQLPANYNFEILKSVWQIRKNKATRIALQFPEGLLMFSLAIADIFEQFCSVETLVMGGNLDH